MTALSEYLRLEAAGLWRAAPDDQRSDVIVSVGDATLTISDMKDQAVAHWSLAAVERANPGRLPAIYHPDGDPGETLELAETEADMIAAIEKLRSAIERRRPHPGRLRLATLLASLAAVAALLYFWLPDAARRHAVSVVPDVKRTEIGQALFAEIQRVTGPPCSAGDGTRALQQLARRLPAATGPGRIVVVRAGVETSTHLPGGTVILNRALVEDYDEPDIAAGYIVAERLRSELNDPLARLLEESGLMASFRLLTTGSLDAKTLQNYARRLLTAPPARIADAALLKGFQAWSVRATPYAYAIDISGETTLGLIEADPFVQSAPSAVLTDADWLRLQGICGG